MTAQKKEQINNVARLLHQWMTIIGFPIIVFLLGDMYKDFKKIRESYLVYSFQITEEHKRNDAQDKKNDQQDRQIESIMNRLFYDNSQKISLKREDSEEN